MQPKHNCNRKDTQELDVAGVKISITIKKALNDNQKVSSTLADEIMVSKLVLSARRDQIHWVKLVLHERDSSWSTGSCNST